jgi:hypothetical protein
MVPQVCWGIQAEKQVPCYTHSWSGMFKQEGGSSETSAHIINIYKVFKQGVHPDIYKG